MNIERVRLLRMSRRELTNGTESIRKMYVLYDGSRDITPDFARWEVASKDPHAAVNLKHHTHIEHYYSSNHAGTVKPRFIELRNNPKLNTQVPRAILQRLVGVLYIKERRACYQAEAFEAQDMYAHCSAALRQANDIGELINDVINALEITK